MRSVRRKPSGCSSSPHSRDECRAQVVPSTNVPKYDFIAYPSRIEAKGESFVQLLNAIPQIRSYKAKGHARVMVMSIRMLLLARRYPVRLDRAKGTNFWQNVKQRQSSGRRLRRREKRVPRTRGATFPWMKRRRVPRKAKSPRGHLGRTKKISPTCRRCSGRGACWNAA